jgi:hypothetical protein
MFFKCNYTLVSTNYISFHGSTINRRQQNLITSIKSTQGNQVTEHAEIEQELIRYFSNLLTEPKKYRGEAISKITINIPKLVSPYQNDALLRPTTLEEVGKVVMEMPKEKSPGPNCFIADFFQTCWPIIKYDVLELVEYSQIFSKVLPTLNATFLALIPKGI